MDSIERGKLKMRKYFAEQRAGFKHPIKVNIPKKQEQKQEDVPNASQPTSNTPLNLIRLGLSISLIGIVCSYIYLTTPSIKVQIDNLIVESIGKLSVLSINKVIIGIILLGVGLAFIGLITRGK